ncbi:hypothetical protein [Agromyces sp. SYSU T00194]|uniref:hypothetical protein n=1 Tax=Agromyces chitinivorans TaxID=3158560 RepID=UPI00339A9477
MTGAGRPRRPDLLGDETGSASLEFVTVGLILLVPLVYLVLAVGAVQAGVLATEGAARHAARVYSLAPDDAAGRDAVERAVAVALADYGIERSAASVSLHCEGGCLESGSRVTLVVRADVTLPLVPPVLAMRERASVPVEASATVPVSRFAGAG